MVKGKTESGFEFEVDETILDDWELVEDLEQCGSNAYAQIHAAKRVFGDKYNDAKEFCRDKETDRIRSDKMLSLLTEVLDSLHAKNS
ncbi:hypothetical protein SAMN02745687_00916 [Lachnospiraceae bacterium NK3A20]|nr:hypothetical protein SAMN02745687_00916 [Lachnospiraceae bacterium NK3A20]